MPIPINPGAIQPINHRSVSCEALLATTTLTEDGLLFQRCCRHGIKQFKGKKNKCESGEESNKFISNLRIFSVFKAANCTNATKVSTTLEEWSSENSFVSLQSSLWSVQIQYFDKKNIEILVSALIVCSQSLLQCLFVLIFNRPF